MRNLAAIIFAAAIAQTAFADRAAAPDPWTPSAGDQISFEVLRKGKPFGDHILSFDEAEDGTLQVTTDVDLKAGLGPITVFRYSLDSTETWQDGKLVSLSGRTNDDGDKTNVDVERNGDTLAVEGTAYTGDAPIYIIPSSHWNIKQMYGDVMLSTEDGELLDITVEQIGRESVSIGDQSIPADHYRLTSDITVDLWYDDAGRWVKLAFDARGQTIEYRLRQLY